MKKIIIRFFIVLGVIQFILILLGAYLYFVDPLNLRSVVSGNINENVPSVNLPTNSNDTPSTKNDTDKHPALSATQEKTLETFGIDPTALPTSITPEQESCFIEKLGAQRVEEIKAGDSPSLFEIGKASGCL